MDLSNVFRVSVPPELAWDVLTDIERIAPCMPGAELQEVDGDEYRGVVKVKVGPITAQYRGKARLVDQDRKAGKAVLRAEGRETRGQGNANATITAEMAGDGDGTKITITTDLTVTGKVAQFGRGVLGDVSGKLLGQFVECLESDVLVARPSPARRDAVPADGPTAAPVNPTSRRVPFKPAKPVDLMSTAGGPLAKRLVPPLIAIVFLTSWLFRRRRRSQQG